MIYRATNAEGPCRYTHRKATNSPPTMSQTSAQFHDQFFITDASVAEGRG